MLFKCFITKKSLIIFITGPECPNGLNCTTPAFISVDKHDNIAPQTVAVPFAAVTVIVLSLRNEYLA